jgi:hypothetical protein
LPLKLARSYGRSSDVTEYELWFLERIAPHDHQDAPGATGSIMTRAEGVKRMMQLSSGSVLVVGVLVVVALLILMSVLSVVRRISAVTR